MSAPFDAAASARQEVWLCWDAETGLTIVEPDPETILLDACLRAAVRCAALFAPLLPVTAAVLGAVWLVAHAATWAGL
jgi:hypothetical protein